MSKYTVAIIRFMSSLNYKPLNGSELRKALDIPKKQKSAFYKDLRKLTKQGKIKKISHSKYVLSTHKRQPKISLLSGILVKKDGSFFLSRDNSEIKLPRLINSLRAAEGDEILVKIQKSNIGITSKVVKVLKRATKSVIGYLLKVPRGWVVKPAERKIPFLINIKADKKLKEGWLVKAKITSAGKLVKGELEKIYGEPFNPEIDENVVIDKFMLPHEFSEEIENELKRINKPTVDDFADRTDFRNLPTITIDGADAKDFDDAVDVELKEDGGFRLYVHIADVSYYVKLDSKLNQEALLRGFSVYFPGSVIPMLPFKLSNDICSLVPNEDRLTVSVIMDISKIGTIKRYKIKESVIRNKNRMTYDEVQDILDGKLKADESLRNILLNMQILAKTLRKRRFKKGSLDLDIPEPYFIMEGNKILDIQERPHKFSHSIIEEFMLAANLCVADFLSKHYEKYIRRIHEEPDPVKIANLTAFLRRMGIKFDLPEKFSSKDLQKILRNIKDNKLKKIVSQLMLRSLKRAEYSLKKEGHFALNFDNYTHFTSPIRRFPDLVVHRMVKSALHKIKDAFMNIEDEVKIIQSRELITENAMFYMNDIKTAQFMKDHIGDEFSGIITTIIPNGFFVRLKEHFVEGFVPANMIKDDYYQYIEYMYAMVGKRKKRVFKLGDEVRVIVVNVDKFAGEIDFTVV